MKKKGFNKRKIVIGIVQLGILGVICLGFLKYSEEIAEIKERVRNEIRYLKEETRIDFTNYPEIAYDKGAWYEEVPLIYHGGGGIDGCDYTNSKEALEQTLAAGHRYVEIDFLYTLDEHLVCAHFWSSLYGDETIPTLEEFKSLKVFGKYTSVTAEQLVAYMAEYEDLYIIIDTKEENYIKNIMECLMIHIFREGSLKEKKPRKRSSQIQKAIQYINIHFKDNPSLTETASVISSNPNYFSQKFKEETGKSYTEYLTERKLSYAKKLLKSGLFTVTEICFASGFTSVSNFLRVFKLNTGISPTQYAKKDLQD